jgi:hypothetical protein
VVNVSPLRSSVMVPSVTRLPSTKELQLND